MSLLEKRLEKSGGATSHFEEKKKERDKASQQEIVLDHHQRVSYITNPNNPKNDYILLVTKIRTKPTKKIHEGDVKKAGKLVHFKRFIYVAPYDYIEILMTDGRKIWKGIIDYVNYNVERKKATQDLTWSEDMFLEKVLETLQYSQHPTIIKEYDPEFKFTDTSAFGSSLTLEYKGKFHNVQVNFIKPCILSELNGASLKDFMEKVFAHNWETLSRHCRTGKLNKAQEIVARGHVDVHYFPQREYGEGWSVLHLAAANGKHRVVQWLVEECRVNIFAKSPWDGWNPFHCACRFGHFEVAEFLHSKGASITETAKNGVDTPITLMYTYKHLFMLKYFIGDNTDYHNELKKHHGKRNKEIPEGMYVLLKPYDKIGISKELTRIFKECTDNLTFYES